MTFWMGLIGFLAGWAAYAMGFWRGRAAGKKETSGKETPERPTLDARSRQEFYNFLHYDGGQMPKPSDDDT